MSLWMTVLVAGSLVVLLGLEAGRAWTGKNWRLFAVEAAAVFLFGAFLHALFGFPVPKSTIAKSGSSSLAVVLALFLCMIAGMFAQFLYNYLAQPQRERQKFDAGLFVRPVFASPIIFIPLLAALQNADVDLTQLTVPRLMVFLVAFQNGFFWKEFFDKQRKGLENK